MRADERCAPDYLLARCLLVCEKKLIDAMNKVIHRAVTRGYADRGWLKSWQTFSFADYYNPSRMYFGALQMLNDNTLAPGEGEGVQPLTDTELVTMPLGGVVRYSDSSGCNGELRPGQIAVLSAGTGVSCGVCNAGRDAPATVLQLGFRTDAPGSTPRCDSLELLHAKSDALRLVVAPEGCGSEHVGWIHCMAWVYTLCLDAGRVAEYRLRVHGDGVYCFLLDGRAEVAGEPLERRDGMGLWEVDEFLIKADTAANLLLVEVPIE